MTTLSECSVAFYGAPGCLERTAREIENAQPGWFHWVAMRASGRTIPWCDRDMDVPPEALAAVVRNGSTAAIRTAARELLGGARVR